MSKEEELKDGFEPVLYSIFNRGVLNIIFSAKDYTKLGAVSRYRKLSKAFPGLLLVAVNNGGDLKVLLPFEGRIKRRNQVTERI